MGRFSEYYKNHLFKRSDGQRLTAVDFLINDIISEMQSAVDPTRWRQLLDQKQLLDLEREDIVARSGDFKMQ